MSAAHRIPLSIPALLLSTMWLLAPVRSQEPVPIAYPERDILSPFRNPTDIVAPPDELFRQLRIMQNIASRARPEQRSFDSGGREIIDDATWRETYAAVQEIGLQANLLAQMMRLHRNTSERETAFYACFYVPRIDHAIELIEHIPGEPARRIREAAMPRAIEFLRAQLGRSFGDLTPEQQEAMRQALPQPGSPAARAKGFDRLPEASDRLHSLRTIPFLQLLDIDDPVDQAQALWFLKKVFEIRIDLALLWLEPSLPRVRQLLLSEDPQVRAEAIGLLQVIGPETLPEPPADVDQLIAWSDLAIRAMFPPIRNLNDSIIQLHPSPERDAIVTAGIAALEHSGIGDPYRGQLKDGTWYRGFRVGHVPDALKPLAIPKDSVVTGVNGIATGNAEDLLQAVRAQLASNRRPLKLLVEYVRNDKPHAVEFRIM